MFQGIIKVHSALDKSLVIKMDLPTLERLSISLSEYSGHNFSRAKSGSYCVFI